MPPWNRATCSWAYSLARAVLGDRPDRPELVDELLRPSVIYSPRMAALRQAVPVHGFAHITGGGLPGNLVRVLPAGCDAVVRRGSWPVPAIFEEIRRRGDIPDDEMARVFNLGIGMVAIVTPADAVTAVDVLGDAQLIGEIVAGTGRVFLL